MLTFKNESFNKEEYRNAVVENRLKLVTTIGEEYLNYLESAEVTFMAQEDTPTWECIILSGKKGELKIFFSDAFDDTNELDMFFIKKSPTLLPSLNDTNEKVIIGFLKELFPEPFSCEWDFFDMPSIHNIQK